MKKYLYVLSILILAASCKQDQPLQTATGLVGKWELTTESGGWAANKTYAAGTGNTIQFNTDSTVIQYQNFNVVRQGSFSIVKNGASDVLYYNHKLWNVMQLNGNTLIIGTTITDGIADTYVRDN